MSCRFFLPSPFAFDLFSRDTPLAVKLLSALVIPEIWKLHVFFLNHCVCEANVTSFSFVSAPLLHQLENETRELTLYPNNPTHTTLVAVAANHRTVTSEGLAAHARRHCIHHIA